VSRLCSFGVLRGWTGSLGGDGVRSSSFCLVKVWSHVSYILMTVQFLRVCWLFGVSSDGPAVVEDIFGGVG